MERWRWDLPAHQNVLTDLSDIAGIRQPFAKNRVLEGLRENRWPFSSGIPTWERSMSK